MSSKVKKKILKLKESSTLVINEKYVKQINKVVKNKQDGETKSFMSDSVGSARWLKRSLEQRNNTTLKIAGEIVNQQSDFDKKGKADNVFDGGVGYGSSYSHPDLSNTYHALEALHYTKDLVKDVQGLRELQSQWGLWIQQIGASEMIEILPRCHEWSSAKNLTWERLLDWLETWLRDLAWLLHELPETELLNQDQLPALRKCLQRYSSESILALYEAVLDVRHNIARNANKTLQLEGLWLRLKNLQEA